MKLISFCLVSLLLFGCTTTTGKVIMTPEKGLLAVHGAHLEVCGAVEKAHTAGVLVGANFNKAKALCVESGDILTQGDQLLAVGKGAEAALKAQAALDEITQAKALSH